MKLLPRTLENYMTPEKACLRAASRKNCSSIAPSAETAVTGSSFRGVAGSFAAILHCVNAGFRQIPHRPRSHPHPCNCQSRQIGSWPAWPRILFLVLDERVELTKPIRAAGTGSVANRAERHDGTIPGLAQKLVLGVCGVVAVRLWVVNGVLRLDPCDWGGNTNLDKLPCQQDQGSACDHRISSWVYERSASVNAARMNTELAEKVGIEALVQKEPFGSSGIGRVDERLGDSL